MKLTVKDMVEELVACADHIKTLIKELDKEDVYVLSVDIDKWDQLQIHFDEESLKYVATRMGYKIGERESGAEWGILDRVSCYDGRVRLFACVTEEDKENETV